MNGERDLPPTLSHGEVARLEEVVDRTALAEVCRSFHALFGLSIRVFSREGTLLADVHTEQNLCQYVNTLDQGRTACGRTVGDVKRLDEDGVVVHPCFTGAVYRVVPIDYQGRRVGRFVVGPYLPAEVREVPKSLLGIDPKLDPERARLDLGSLPRVRNETSEKISLHLRSILDLILFSSHRAHLTSEMHIASVRESFRELAEKNSRLESAYERLKELDRLKSNFLATISHELRTPLTSIIGYSEMLESGMAGDMNADQTEFVGIIRQKGEHLLELITSLLDLGKLEQGTLRLDLVEVDVGGLLVDLKKTFHPRATKKGVEVELVIPDEALVMKVDVIRFRQVLFNLVENAVKFTPSGGKVTVSARNVEMVDDTASFGAALMDETRLALEVRITDTGIGMEEAQLSRIFDAFYQVDGGSTREHGGAGLGLNIVRRIVEAHGGTVSVTSRVGVGTTFAVVVPHPEE